MGYDAYVHINKKYTKANIEKLLLMLGYEKRKDFFYCGNDDEYKYFTGVQVWLCDENKEERIYNVRCPIFAVAYDLKKVNETIRSLKQYCDATFESDIGKNRYFPESQFTKGAESGCYFAVERLFNNFTNLRYALSKYPADMESDKELYKIGGHLTLDMFNANVYSTYLCSLIEEYFRSTYIALLKYSDRKEKILKVKFTPYDLVDISNGDKTVEEVFARTLSFQNIHNICYNFHDLNSKLDLGQALKSPYRNRKKNLYEQIDEILERRHGLIHRLEIDYDYRTYNLQGDIDDVIIAIKRTYCYICNSYGWEKKELSL